MAKPKITRTYGPIHFEDLDPHRFEDLIRELIYDYKDWQIIEATGRSGGDEGFDIRAYEKVSAESSSEKDGDSEIKEPHPMDGNLWMIQGKREKGIGPKRIEEILKELDKENPPYGYILATSSDLSKKSRDIFREELKKKGVMEFYVWSKAELEDMLHWPKNDRILFTFFGISLVSKRKSRISELRSNIVIKNKLFRAFDSEDRINKSALLRDVKDTHYPYDGEYKDFEKNPKWREYQAKRHHPLGVWFHVQEYYAYVDKEKKEWGFTRSAKLAHKEREYDNDRQKRFDDSHKVRRIWDFFKRSNQAKFYVDGFVKYESIEIVDDKGDNHYKFPHLYVDFKDKSGPFSWYNNFFKLGEEKIELDDSWKEINIFPESFPEKPVIGKINKQKKITFDAATLTAFKETSEVDFLCEVDGRYDYLQQKDVVSISGTSDQYSPEDRLIQVTNRFKIKVKDYLLQGGLGFGTNRNISRQLEREPDPEEEINIYEFKTISKWDIEDAKKNK